MARPPKCRRVEFLPQVTKFKPMGVPGWQLEEVVLTVEELEAIRLKDQEGLEQEDCAQRMEISRPTFHRIITAARAKVAEALIEGKALCISGGTFRVAAGRFRCGVCQHDWHQESLEPGSDLSCPQCESGQVSRERGRHGRRGRGYNK